MPFVHVRALSPAPDFDFPAAADKLCKALAPVVNTTPHKVYVSWEELPARHYVTGDGAPERQPKETHPVFVQIMTAEGRPQEIIESMLTVTAETLAPAFGVTLSNIVVELAEFRVGKQYTEGAVTRPAVTART